MYGLTVLLLTLSLSRADTLTYKVTGLAQFSKNSGKLLLKLQGSSPNQTPTGKPTAGGGLGPQPPGGVQPKTPTGKPTTGGPGPQPPGGVQQAGEFSPFAQEALKVHNRFRATHNVPLMTLDKAMCQQAAAYAAKLANMGTLQHSAKDQRQGQGENLSMGCSTKGGQTATQAVSNWYNEVCDPGYNFERSGFQGGAGHFTQVVWKASTVLGIGKADIQKRGMKCTYIVGRYKPQGNFDTGNNDYQKNVLKGSFQKSYCNTVPRGFKDKPSNATAASPSVTIF